MHHFSPCCSLVPQCLALKKFYSADHKEGSADDQTTGLQENSQIIGEDCKRGQGCFLFWLQLST